MQKTTPSKAPPLNQIRGNEEKASLPLMFTPARLAVGLEPLSVPDLSIVSPDPVSRKIGSPADRTQVWSFGRQTCAKYKAPAAQDKTLLTHY